MNAQELSPGLVIQNMTTPRKLSDFKLIAFDMDSTLINIECIDEVADAVGLKAQVAAITEATMRGEIADFKTSLRRRVALLKGVSVASMESVYAERLQLNPGATELVAACQQAGRKVLFLTKDASRFKIVDDDGRVGDVVDFDDLARLKSWMRQTLTSVK